MKLLKYLGLLLFLLAGTFIIGPRPSFEKVNNIPLSEIQNVLDFEKRINLRESKIPHIKEDNEARIVWADSSKQKTPYSIVYIHGFSASQGEGYPMHLNIADSIGANMYLARLPEHGTNHLEAMDDLTPVDMVNSAKEAIAIGKAIGEKVVVMGCSTGGTLGIYLAAGDPNIDALILLSPNIEVKVEAMKLITGPWGQALTQQLLGEHRVMDSTQSYIPYWSHQYHTNGLIALQALLDQTMTEEVFAQLDLPIYCGYYFKNEEQCDRVVSINAILEFQDALTIPKNQMEFEAFEEGNHVLGSIYKNDNWKEVQEEVLDFLDKKVL